MTSVRKTAGVCLAGVLILVFAFVSDVSGQNVTFTNRAAFEAAVGGSSVLLESFDNFAPGQQVPQLFGGLISFDPPFPTVFFGNWNQFGTGGQFSGGGLLPERGTSLTIRFSPPVFAVGGNAYDDFDPSTSIPNVITFTATTSLGTTFSVSETFPSIGDTGFLGATSPEGIVEAVFSIDGPFFLEVDLLTVAGGNVVVRVDANRDGEATIDDDSDVTTEQQPFRFWLNNDRDDFDLSDGVVSDLDPSVGSNLDSDNITSFRDLEDFTQLSVRLPLEFDPFNSDWTVEVSFVASSGAPTINLFRAVAPGRAYLEDLAVAQAQLSRGAGTRVTSTPVQISSFIFDPADRTAHFLFEGAAEGCGALSVQVLRAGTEFSAGEAHLCLHDIKAFYDHWTVGDHAALAVGPLTSVQSASSDVIVGSSSDYVLFVHGWRMQPWERRAFAETAYKRLWHQGFVGRFGLFSWPTGWIPRPNWYRATLARYIRENYDISEMSAWLSARGLHELLGMLWTDPSIRTVGLLAHSMGNVVSSEALRTEAESGAGRQLVGTYVASQAAISATAYSLGRVSDEYSRYPLTGRPYFSMIDRAASKVVNFVNEDDDALYWGWRTNNLTKPDQALGCFELRGNGRNRPPDPLRPYRRWNVPLEFGRNTYEIFSLCARAAPRDGDLFGKALGASLGLEALGTPISRTVNLGARFGYGSAPTDHSAQFMREIQTRRSYWVELLDVMGIPHR